MPTLLINCERRCAVTVISSSPVEANLVSAAGSAAGVLCATAPIEVVWPRTRQHTQVFSSLIRFPLKRTPRPYNVLFRLRDLAASVSSPRYRCCPLRSGQREMESFWMRKPTQHNGRRAGLFTAIARRRASSPCAPAGSAGGCTLRAPANMHRRDRGRYDPCAVVLHFALL